MGDNDPTGATPPVTTEPAGGDPQVPATEPQPGTAPVPASVTDETQALRTQLEEQRSIQAGLDRKTDELTKQTGKLQSENTELEKEIVRLNEVAFAGDDVKAKYEEELTRVRDETATEVAEVTAQLQVAQQALAVAQQQSDRLRVIAAEYPDLAPLLDADALPQAATLGEFREKLATLSDSFVPSAQAAARAKAQGARPPASPPASPTVNLDNVMDEMNTALREGNKTRYDELKEQWYSASDTLKG